MESILAPYGRGLLIVDDDSRLREILVECYTDKLWKVGSAGDAYEAIQLLNHRHFHVVLTDFRMPGMNGLGLARWVRTNRPGTAVCLMSSDLPNGECGAIISPSVDGWVAKPFSIAMLDECLLTVIAQAASRVNKQAVGA